MPAKKYEIETQLRAKCAREAERVDAADWFDSLVGAEPVHLGVLRRGAAVEG